MLSEESQRGRFVIALEGPDYSGKTTAGINLWKLITAHLSRTNPIKSTHRTCYMYKRPGGTLQCDKLRDLIRNSHMGPHERQRLAMSEEIMFRATITDIPDIIILDRYNPISGQVYGPDSEDCRDNWKSIANHYTSIKPDVVVFLEPTLDLVKSRYERSEKNVMDEIFISKSSHILHKYSVISRSNWVCGNFKTAHIQIGLDGSQDTVDSRLLTVFNDFCPSELLNYGKVGFDV